MGIQNTLSLAPTVELLSKTRNLMTQQIKFPQAFYLINYIYITEEEKTLKY